MDEHYYLRAERYRFVPAKFDSGAGIPTLNGLLVSNLVLRFSDITWFLDFYLFILLVSWNLNVKCLQILS